MCTSTPFSSQGHERTLLKGFERFLSSDPVDLLSGLGKYGPNDAVATTVIETYMQSNFNLTIRSPTPQKFDEAVRH